MIRASDEVKQEEKSDTFAFIMLGFLYFVQVEICLFSRSSIT